MGGLGGQRREGERGEDGGRESQLLGLTFCSHANTSAQFDN